MLFSETAQALATLDAELLNTLAHLVQTVRQLDATVYLAGNGGSFTTALHWACDLEKVGRLRTRVLGANGGALTAQANDVSFTTAFSHEFATNARMHDIVIAISCSGASPNVIELLETAKRLRRPSVLITSDRHWSEDWAKGQIANQVIRVHHENYGVIENCHLAIGHWLTDQLRAAP